MRGACVCVAELVCRACVRVVVIACTMPVCGLGVYAGVVHVLDGAWAQCGVFEGGVMGGMTWCRRVHARCLLVCMCAGEGHGCVSHCAGRPNGPVCGCRK